ncbi:MAG: hypothetical protein HFH82_03155 [Lachnospiraceae bacterium]|nr:hypothetical protein [Lachnospiraceae bacterium]
MKLTTKMKRFLFTAAFCATAFSGCFLTVPSTALTVQASEDAGIQPLADVKEWRATLINGRKYIRLYNLTKQQWEGDWIYVGDI